YSATLDRLAFAGHAPDLAVQNVAGRFGVRDDDLHVEKLFLQTPQSSLTIDGVVRQYLSTPSLQVTASAPALSLPEFSGVLPILRGYDLRPTFDVKAEGPRDRLALALNATSAAGEVHGRFTSDLDRRGVNARGEATVRHLDLAQLLKSPAQKSDITGYGRFDFRIDPGSTPPMDRLRA